MAFIFPPYTVIFVAGLLISVVLSIIAWNRRPAPGAVLFALFVLAGAVWSFFWILEIGSQLLSSKILWAKLENIGILATGVLWLAFVLDYSGNPWWRRPRNLLILSAVPLITLLMVWTNEWHGWYYSDIYSLNGALGEVTVWQHGPWFWVSAVYQYALILWGAIILWRFGLRNRTYGKQIAALTIGIMAPILGNIAYLFSSNVLGGVDFTPIALAVSQLIYTVTIFRYGFLDPAAVARRASFDSIPDGIIVLDGASRIVDINEAAEMIMGLLKEAALGKPLEELWPGLYLVVAVMDTGEHLELDPGLCGNASNLDISVTTLSGKNGAGSGKLIILHNITQQKVTEDILREREQYYKTVLDSLRAGVVTVDAQTHRIEDVNQYAAELMGEEKDNIIGRSYHQFVDPEAAGQVEVTDLKQQVDVSQRSMLTAGGRALPIIRSVIPVMRKGREYLIESFIDISSLKKATEVLESQKELIDRILSTLPASVLVTNEHNNVLLANRAYYNGFKLSPAEVEDRPICEILPVEELLKAISSASTGREPQVQLEFRYSLDDNERIVVAQVLSMKNRRALIILSDITEERGHQQKLHLADRLASVGEMAAGISHELNNPLTNILLMSQLLIEDEIPDAVKEELLLINKEARRASSVVKNLLTFARKRDAVKQLSQVNSIIADVLKLRAYEHKVNNIEVAMDLDIGLPDILVDYFQMQQVFMNIILNAEQVMTESSGKGKLTVTTGQQNGNISVKFSDDGPGIKEGNMSHIFDPFFTTKEVGKGTGLGLSICYGIIRGHNGRIYAESESGKGATFTVELPVLNRQRTGALA
jgi:PAS domain S-box-containing protein